jgi:hypothetical protein
VIDIRGAIDLHLHAKPSLFPRLATDREVAKAASQAGLAGILLKSHHESTVDRALKLAPGFPDLRIFGGIVLNNHVGGIDPVIVESALESGAKQVWLPTIDANAHARAFGGTGGFDTQAMRQDDRGAEGINLIKEDKLRPEVVSVLGLVAEYDAILGTAHQSYEELRLIIPQARQAGVEKILLTHPFFVVPRLSLEQTEELVAQGATAEFTYCTVSPKWACATIAAVAEAAKTLGAENCILTSDAGQPYNPMPPEALRLFAQGLSEMGVAETDIDLMIRRNPARLLGL